MSLFFEEVGGEGIKVAMDCCGTYIGAAVGTLASVVRDSVVRRWIGGGCVRSSFRADKMRWRMLHNKSFLILLASVSR